MQIQRSERIWLKPDGQLNKLCHISKNLYNEANYIIRQEFTKGKHRTYLNYYEMYKIMKDKVTFKQLPCNTSQQILMVLDRNWKSFFRSIKDWSKNKSKYRGQPNLPKYKKKDGSFMLIFTSIQCKIRDGELIFPKVINMKIKTRLKDVKLNQTRIIPKGIGYVLEIVYTKEVKILELNKNNILGIDMGVRNFITMGNNIGLKPIVVKGGVIKSTNQFYNKQLAKLQNKYDTLKIKKNTKKLSKLNDKKYKKMEDYFHKTSRFVIRHCIENNIGTIVIGYNKLWKQETKLGKKNTQNFVGIPFYKLVQKLSYKSEEVGIELIKIEEGHTSKCSFLDNEPIEHSENYVGKRVSRGVFRSEQGTLINADVNASYNIIKKAIPNAFGKADGIEGVALHPTRCDVL